MIYTRRTALTVSKLLWITLLTANIFAQTSAPTGQKQIKDPAEYNAYMAALNTQDPAQRSAAMELFCQQYPNSIVKTDALEQAMAAYQQAGTAAKVEDIANRILQLDPQTFVHWRLPRPSHGPKRRRLPILRSQLRACAVWQKGERRSCRAGQNLRE